MSGRLAFQPVLALGLMSGTSLDGVDVALLRTDGERQISFQAQTYFPYPEDFQLKLQQLAREDIPLNDVLRIEHKLTAYHQAAIRQLLEEQNLSTRDIAVIGFHGQTIRHLPEEALTWQLGNPSQLKAAFGIPVVNDFRRLDMAHGGQGAPLLPLYHAALCDNVKEPIAIVNIGGVANLTYISPDGSVIATDTGPGVGLLNELALKELNKPFDEDGKFAAQGEVKPDLFKKWFEDCPFFTRSYPKAADRYEFTAVNVQAMKPTDAAATLAAFTAESIAKAAGDLPEKPAKIYVTGGGAKHPLIMSELAKSFEHVGLVEELNWRGETMEAEGFAWLAVRHLRGLPLSVPTTTGVSMPVCGGQLTA